MTRALKKLLRPREVSFWGADYTVTPLLCDKVFGDGLRVISFVPLATRPERYIIQTDSKTDMESDRWYDELDDIWEALEDQFGRASYKDEDDNRNQADWPAADDSCGCAWNELLRLRKNTHSTI